MNCTVSLLWDSMFDVQPGGGELLFPVTLSTKDPVIRTDDKPGVLSESLRG